MWMVGNSTTTVLSRMNFIALFARVTKTRAASVQAATKTTSPRGLGVNVTESQSASKRTTPVAVLLGWNSSKDKHLAKYSELFERKNFDTIRVTANPFNTVFRSGTKAKRISHFVLDTMVELGCKKRPVFLYVFSNGGCVMYFHILQALTTAHAKYYNALRITGTILDSCPIDTSMKIVKIVQESVTQSITNPVIKSIVWYSLGLFTPLVIPDAKRFMTVLVNSPMKSPQLLMFSRADKVAPFEDIEMYAVARKEQGVEVRSKCWENSQHVSHYRESPQEYAEILDEFTEYCLRKSH